MNKAVVPRNYTEASFEFIIQCLALHGGSAHRAVKALERMDPDDLAELGVDHIPDKSVLIRWKDRYPERYAQIRDDKVLAIYRARAAEAHSAHADAELEVSGLILDRLRDNVDQLDARDLAGALRNTDTGAAINRDKAGLLRGENMGAGIQVNLNIGELVRSSATTGARWVDADGKPLTADQAVAIAEGKAIEGSATELEGESE